MANRIRTSIVLRSALAALCLSGAWAAAQTGASEQHSNMQHDEDKPRVEVTGRYDYVRSNAPPDGCTCFGLNGGGAGISIPMGWNFAWIGDFSFTHAGGIGSDGYSLTLSTYTTGARYREQVAHSRIYPFAQAMIGAAHAAGSLVDGDSPRVANAGGSFAVIGGGGVDLRLTRRFWIRAGEVDYVMTTFDNGSNNRQNNLRAGAGVIFRF